MSVISDESLRRFVTLDYVSKAQIRKYYPEWAPHLERLISLPRNEGGSSNATCSSTQSECAKYVRETEFPRPYHCLHYGLDLPLCLSASTTASSAELLSLLETPYEVLMPVVDRHLLSHAWVEEEEADHDHHDEKNLSPLIKNEFPFLEEEEGEKEQSQNNKALSLQQGKVSSSGSLPTKAMIASVLRRQNRKGHHSGKEDDNKKRIRQILLKFITELLFEILVEATCCVAYRLEIPSLLYNQFCPGENVDSRDFEETEKTANFSLSEDEGHEDGKRTQKSFSFQKVSNEPKGGGDGIIVLNKKLVLPSSAAEQPAGGKPSEKNPKTTTSTSTSSFSTLSEVLTQKKHFKRVQLYVDWCSLIGSKNEYRFSHHPPPQDVEEKEKEEREMEKEKEKELQLKKMEEEKEKRKKKQSQEDVVVDEVVVEFEEICTVCRTTTNIDYPMEEWEEWGDCPVCRKKTMHSLRRIGRNTVVNNNKEKIQSSTTAWNNERAYVSSDGGGSTTLKGALLGQKRKREAAFQDVLEEGGHNGGTKKQQKNAFSSSPFGSLRDFSQSVCSKLREKRCQLLSQNEGIREIFYPKLSTRHTNDADSFWDPASTRKEEERLENKGNREEKAKDECKLDITEMFASSRVGRQREGDRTFGDQSYVADDSSQTAMRRVVKLTPSLFENLHQQPEKNNTSLSSPSWMKKIYHPQNDHPENNKGERRWEDDDDEEDVTAGVGRGNQFVVTVYDITSALSHVLSKRKLL